MIFPDWAPKALCDYYNDFSECPAGDQQPFKCPLTDADMIAVWKKFYDPLLNDGNMIRIWKDLLKRLLTDRDMVQIWNEYKKMFPQDPDLRITRDELFPCLVASYAMSMREHPTRSEREAKMEEIGKKTKDLARCIRGTDYDLSANSFLVYLDCGVEKLQEKVGSDVDFESSLNRLTISRILEDIGKGAEFDLELSRTLENPGPEAYRPLKYVPNPGARNAQSNRLIREMSLVFRLHLGGERPRLLARLVRVALQPHLDADMDIDESTAKTSLREWYRTYPHLRESLAQREVVYSILASSRLLS